MYLALPREPEEPEHRDCDSAELRKEGPSSRFSCHLGPRDRTQFRFSGESQSSLDVPFPLWGMSERERGDVKVRGRGICLLSFFPITHPDPLKNLELSPPALPPLRGMARRGGETLPRETGESQGQEFKPHPWHSSFFFFFLYYLTNETNNPCIPAPTMLCRLFILCLRFVSDSTNMHIL